MVIGDDLAPAGVDDAAALREDDILRGNCAAPSAIEALVVVGGGDFAHADDTGNQF